jgi:D-alanine-D-alanine ligase-like ATP-grasp enzyme
VSDTKAKKIKRVGVLRGGAGKHYASSLQKGGEVISCIFENLADKYKTFDILVDRDNVWHLNGVPIIPADLFHKVDIVWNTSHSNFSNVLESLSIPHISVGAFSSGLQSSKDFLREHIKGIGLQMPRCVVSPKNAREVLEKFSGPWIVKVSSEIMVAKNFNELAEAIGGRDNVMVEEFIAGKVASVHSVPDFRGEKVYTFPLGNSYGIFSPAEKEKLANIAKALHKHIGAKHYLKSDFVLNPRGKVYLLQINGTPDLNPDSHFTQVCISVGAKTYHVIEHILDQV